MNESMVSAALQLAKIPWAVFPVRPDSKRPYTAHGFKNATTDPDQIRSYWKKWPDAKIGFRTGLQANGSCIAVLDVDGEKGQEALDKLEAKHGKLPPTLRANTPSGWYHLYFRHDASYTIRNKDLAPSINVRGQGGYVVIPPSAEYEWNEEFDLASIARMPLWAVTSLHVEPQKSAAVAAPLSPNGKGQYLAGRAVKMVMEDGSDRNETGLWLACQLRDSGYTEEEIISIGFDEYVSVVANARPDKDPYTKDEFNHTAAQALTRPPRESPPIPIAVQIGGRKPPPAGRSIFWQETKTGIKILPTPLREFLEGEGFGKVYLHDQLEPTLVRIVDRVVKVVSAPLVKDYALEYVRSLPEKMGDVDSLKILLAFERVITRQMSPAELERLTTIDLHLVRSTAVVDFRFYRNGVVKITPDEITVLPYSSLNGHIWHSQIRDRDFDTDALVDCDFRQLMWRIGRNDPSRMEAMTSALGYLMHDYKNPANTKAIIFVDEALSAGTEGRSGKTVVAKFVSHMAPLAWQDAKNFSFNSPFAFQSVRHDTKVMLFDDCGKKFPFERLFSAITGPLVVEQKNKPSIEIPFKDTPKILITTNYMVEGSGGSFLARVFYLEFSDYYDAVNTPEKEFGHLLFEGWDKTQWKQADKLAALCVQQYLASGLVSYKHVNVKKNQLLQNTSENFMDWLYPFPEVLVFGEKLSKQTLYEDFLPFDSGVARQTFTKFLKLWAASEGHKTSIARDTIMFTKAEPIEEQELPVGDRE